MTHYKILVGRCSPKVEHLFTVEPLETKAAMLKEWVRLQREYPERDGHSIQVFRVRTSYHLMDWRQITGTG